MPQERKPNRWKRRLVALALILAVLLGLPWLVCASMPGASHAGPLPPLDDATRTLAGELRATVFELCSRGERNLQHPDGLAHAIETVERHLARAGKPVTREGYFADLFGAGEGPAPDSFNLFVDLPGDGTTDGIVVVGAHYDSVLGSPGANDNGSGVAALCALAPRLAALPRARTVRLVAFANEEPPYYHTPAMGSRVHAERAKQRGERIAAMLSLETLGCYSDAPGSQRYPVPLLALAYPTRADFVAFVGDLGARALVRRCVGTFREHARFPSEGAALPAWIPGVDWSDHESFRREGWPALMVTDTALFRSGDYHETTDTPEKLDYERLARVVLGLERVLDELARAPE
jgi:hypothetical protein